MSNWAIELCKAGGVVGLFAYLIQSGLLRFEDLERVGDRWPWLVVAQIPFAVLLLAAALRWHLLLRAQAIALPFRDTYAIMLIGWFFNQTMPSSTGGDVAKAAAIGLEQPQNRTVAIMSIFVDRFVGLLTLLVFALALCAFGRDRIAESALLSSICFGIAGLLAAAVCATALFYSARFRAGIAPLLRRLGLHADADDGARPGRAPATRPHAGTSASAQRGSGPGGPTPDEGDPAPDAVPARARLARRLARALVRIDAAVYAYRNHPRTLALCFAASLGLHAMTLALNLILTWIVLGESFDVAAVIVIVPMAHIGMAVPLTPGSIAIGEGIYGALFSTIGIAQGSTIGLLQRLVWWSWAAVGATVFLARRKTGRSQIPAASSH